MLLQEQTFAHENLDRFPDRRATDAQGGSDLLLPD